MRILKFISSLFLTHFPIKHNFKRDFGISLMGKKLHEKKIVDTSQIAKNIIAYSSINEDKICYLSYEIDRPKHKVNRLKQKIALIKKIEKFFKKHPKDYNEKSFLRNDIILFNRVGDYYNQYYTEVKILFHSNTIEFQIKQTKLYEEGLKHEVNNDYQKYKREITL